jgi:putative PIN family toxin of toxin-antitoxin system
MNKRYLIKVVFDSNILISAFLVKGGASYHLLEAARRGVVLLYLSDEILEETQTVLLTYERIRKRYQYSDDSVRRFVQGVKFGAHAITDLPDVQVSRDPKDDMVIATAMKANAHYLVTRDKDLLVLKRYKKRGKILPPEDFLKILRRQGNDLE